MIAEVSDKEIRRRQGHARELNERLRRLLEGEKNIAEHVRLIVWHGSLPRGEGGQKYDIDYAIFLEARGPQELVQHCRSFLSAVTRKLPRIIWRDDLHYDGMNMFEAHSHWDLSDVEGLHVGVHLFQRTAVNELLGRQSWRLAEEGSCSFLRELSEWRRFCFYKRHWVYEGVPVYDPEGLFARMSAPDHRMPNWMRKRLREAVKSSVSAYEVRERDVCTVTASKTSVVEMVAALAYSNEDRPIGREARYATDAKSLCDPLACQLLDSAVRGDLASVAKLLG